MYRAQEVQEAPASELCAIVSRPGLMPKVSVISEDAPNTCATEHNPRQAAVAVTPEIRDPLDREELAEVSTVPGTTRVHRVVKSRVCGSMLQV
jgi:Zn-dependent protease with chaperone function